MHTEFAPLHRELMSQLLELVQKHGFNFQLIANQMGLPVDLIKSVSTTYYSHLLSQQLYIPCSILKDISLIYPPTRQQTSIRPLSCCQTWFERFQPLLNSSKKELLQFIVHWHKNIFLSGKDMWRSMGYAGDFRRNELEKKLRVVSDHYLTFEYLKDGEKRSTLYYTPKWPFASDTIIVGECQRLLFQGFSQQPQSKCRCQNLSFVLEVIGDEYQEVLKNDVVRAVIKSYKKLTDDSFFSCYIIDVCGNLLRHNNAQQWSPTVKLFCASLLFRVGYTTFSELIRGPGNGRGATDVDLKNFNLLLPCAETVRASIPEFEWKNCFSDQDADNFASVLKNHNPKHSQSIVAVVQTDATDLTKRLCLGKDNLVYGHVSGVLTPEKFFQLEKSLGEFKKEDFCGKAVVSIGCDLSGNCTLPIYYYTCHAETGENVSSSCQTISSKLLMRNVKKVIHVMDAGSGNRSYVDNSENIWRHWCYVHLMKSGANHLENTKLYPIKSMKYPDMQTIQSLQSVTINVGRYNMIKCTVSRQTSNTQTITMTLNDSLKYYIEWKTNEKPVCNDLSDPGIYFDFDNHDSGTIVLMTNELIEFERMTITNTGVNELRIHFNFLIVQAFGKKMLQAIFNLDPNVYRKLASIQTINWTDKQSEEIAADICTDVFVNYIKTIPGAEALALYLENLQFYGHYNERIVIEENERFVEKPKFSLDMIIKKVKGVISYLDQWYDEMKCVIKARSTVWITPVYLQCLKENYQTLNCLKGLIEESNMILDPHVLCTNRVEGFFGFMRHFSNTFDTYQFAIRYEFVTYELIKALTHRLPYHNRLSRSYRVNPALVSSSNVLEELASRKSHSYNRVQVSTDRINELKDRLLLYHCFKHKTIRQAHYQRTAHDADQMLTQTHALCVPIPKLLVPKKITVVDIPTFTVTNAVSQVEQISQSRCENIQVIGNVCGSGTYKRNIFNKYRSQSSLTCSIYLTNSLACDNDNYLSSFKLKLVTAKSDNMTPYEEKIHSLKLETRVITFEVIPQFCNGKRLVVMCLYNDFERFSSKPFALLKGASKSSKLPSTSTVPGSPPKRQKLDMDNSQC